MEVLTPNTLIPLGSVVSIGGLVWWFAGKLNAVVSKVEFTKHLLDDEARHVSTTEKLNNLQIAQAVENIQLTGINARLDSIQADVKDVLKKAV